MENSALERLNKISGFVKFMVTGHMIIYYIRVYDYECNIMIIGRTAVFRVEITSIVILVVL